MSSDESMTRVVSRDSWDLWEEVDKYLSKQLSIKAPKQRTFRPTEASVKTATGEVIGKCLRENYYRQVGAPQTPSTSTRLSYLGWMGKTFENGMRDIFKSIGVFETDAVRFFLSEYEVSGEIDFILKRPDGSLVGLEMKTYSLYSAESSIMGNSKAKGKPKDAHLLQTLVYLWAFKGQLDTWLICYLGRDSLSRRTFTIQLVPKDGKTYYSIDGEVQEDFTIEDMMNRYKELGEYVDRCEVPEREFKPLWEPDFVHAVAAASGLASPVSNPQLYQIGKRKISKTNYEAYVKGKAKILMDDNCKYCPYIEHCIESGESNVW